jgi:cbb3-type cytochrome oxidase subunit 3
MSETTLVRDPKLVSIVDKLKTGKIETEIGYAQVGLTILLGIFFVAITALGIDKYNKCEGIQDSEKYANLKMFMSHTMTVAITIPIVLLLMKFVNNEGGVFTMVYAIMGLTASAIAMDVMRQPECEASVKDSDKNFATMSIVAWILLLLAGSFFTFKKYPKLGEVFKKNA